MFFVPITGPSSALDCWKTRLEWFITYGSGVYIAKGVDICSFLNTKLWWHFLNLYMMTAIIRIMCETGLKLPGNVWTMLSLGASHMWKVWLELSLTLAI